MVSSLLIVSVLGALLLLSFAQASWSKRKAFELRQQILEVVELAVRRRQSVVPVMRKLAWEQGRRNRGILTRVARELERGEDLSEALYWVGQQSFPPRVLSVIREADGSAQFAEVLASVAEQTDESLAVHHRLVMALLYPLCLALGVLFAQEAVIRTYSFMPGASFIAGWFSVGDLLPNLPRRVDPWLVFSTGVLTTILITHYAWRSVPLVRRVALHLVAGIPWVSNSGRYFAASQFLMTLSHLVARGQSLPAAMRRAIGAAGTPRLEQRVEIAAAALEAGQSLNDAWRLTGLPEFAVASVAASAGAGRGDFAQVLRRVSIACRDRYVMQRERAMDLLHPAGLLLLGVPLAVNFGVMMSLTGHVREAYGLW